MSQFKEMKFLVDNNPDVCELVQTTLFGLGYAWQNGGVSIQHMGALYLTTYTDGIIRYGDTPQCYHLNDKPDMDIGWMFPDRETVDIGGKTYYATDVETALSSLTQAEV